MSCFQILPLDNSFVIQWGSAEKPVINSVTGVIDTGATVTVTLEDSSGAEVGSQVWPVLMLHVSGGIYRATLSPQAGLADGESYTAIINAIGSGSEVAKIAIDCIARIRRR